MFLYNLVGDGNILKGGACIIAYFSLFSLVKNICHMK